MGGLPVNEINAIKGVYRLLDTLEYFNKHVTNIAKAEGMPAHAMSVKVRVDMVKEFVAKMEETYRRAGHDIQLIREEFYQGLKHA